MTSGGQARSTEGAKVFYLSERRRAKQSARNEAARVEAFGLLGLPILQADVSPILRIGERAVSKTAAYLDLGTNTKVARALLELIQGIKRTEAIEVDSKGAWIAGPYRKEGILSGVNDILIGRDERLIERGALAANFLLKIPRGGGMLDNFSPCTLTVTDGIQLTGYFVDEITSATPHRWIQSDDPKIGSTVDLTLANAPGVCWERLT